MTGQSAPQRIQLSRRKGWRKPDGAIVVARPSKWGNPYAVTTNWLSLPEDFRHGYGATVIGGGRLAWFADRERAVQHAVDLFRAITVNGLDLTSLRGHDLACWCPLEDAQGNRVPCHADVLLEIANPGLVLS